MQVAQEISSPQKELEARYARVETTRARLQVLAYVLVVLLAVGVLALVPYIVRTTRPTQTIEFNVQTLIAQIGFFVIAAIPMSAIVLAALFAGTGVRLRYLGVGPCALVRQGDRWRFVRVRRDSGTQVALPTADSVDAFMRHERRVLLAFSSATLLRGVLLIWLAYVVAEFVRGGALVPMGYFVFGVAALGYSVVLVLIWTLDLLLTRGLERPVVRARRRAVLVARGEIIAGTRPRDIEDHYLDSLRSGGERPEERGTEAVHWMQARLTAAHCLADRGHTEEALQLLRQAEQIASAETGIARGEVRFALAYYLAATGTDMHQARTLLQSPMKKRCEPHERLALDAWLAYHAHQLATARDLAQQAIQRSQRATQAGLAGMLREQMQRLTDHIDAEWAASAAVAATVAATPTVNGQAFWA